MLPTGIASYSPIGEKVQKSLEPLLATPTTDGEILLGKSMAAFIPTIAATYIGAAIFMVLMDVFTVDKLSYLFFPNWIIAIILFMLAPLTCILSIEINVLISSRFNDMRSAQQFGILMFLPFFAIYILGEIGVFSMTSTNLLIMASIVLAIDIMLSFFVKSTFQRDEILTRWK